MVQDHLGNAFSNNKEMCKHWNIPPSAFYTRKKRGSSLQDALTTPLRKFSCKDHLGKAFPSFAQMCTAWNKPKTAVQSRLNRGWSLKKALTEPINKLEEQGQTQDHLGNTYKNENAMRRAYNVSPTTFKWRKEQGWTTKECLLGKRKEQKIYYDHLGNAFSSLEDLTQYYQISVSSYYKRLNAG